MLSHEDQSRQRQHCHAEPPACHCVASMLGRKGMDCSHIEPVSVQRQLASIRPHCGELLNHWYIYNLQQTVCVVYCYHVVCVNKLRKF